MPMDHKYPRTIVLQMHFKAVAGSLVLKYHIVYFQKLFADLFLSHIFKINSFSKFNFHKKYHMLNWSELGEEKIAQVF